MAGTITYSNEGGRENVSSFASGKVALDVSEAEKIYCGFQPSRIEMVWIDAGGTYNQIYIWTKGIAEGSCLKIAADGALSLITYTSPPTPSLGVPYLVSDSDGEGFGFTAAPANLVDTNDIMYWTAWR